MLNFLLCGIKHTLIEKTAKTYFYFIFSIWEGGVNVIQYIIELSTLYIKWFFFLQWLWSKFELWTIRIYPQNRSHIRKCFSMLIGGNVGGGGRKSRDTVSLSHKCAPLSRRRNPNTLLYSFIFPQWTYSAHISLNQYVKYIMTTVQNSDIKFSFFL